MKYYKKQETVIELGGAEFTEFKFVFSLSGISAKSRIEGAITGNGSALVKAHVSPDRASDYVYVNVDRVPFVEVTLVDVPVTVLADIDSLESLDEDSDEFQEVSLRLHNYFELD